MKKQAKKKAVKEMPDFLSALLDPNRFEKRPDGWVKDRLLGVEWGPSSAERMNLAVAKKFCADQGGRLPTVEELHSLVDYGAHDPAVLEPFAKDTKSDDWYWSCTPHHKYQGYAWCVDFFFGFVNDGLKDFNNCVRPVRASQ